MILAGHGPSPGTARFRPLDSLQSVHPRTLAAILLISFPLIGVISEGRDKLFFLLK
jgi:hypothetical protein